MSISVVSAPVALRGARARVVAARRASSSRVVASAPRRDAVVAASASSYDRAVLRTGRPSVRCAATDGSDDDKPSDSDGLSSSFAEELRRRQSGASEAPSGAARDDKWAGGEQSDAPRFARDDGARGVETEQLKRSRALQNEGLEGFPTRAGELLKLGFTSFISFGPLIAVFSVVFVASYLLFGSDFIHGGEGYGGAPAYVPPEVLLAEPTVDRMVPMYDPIPYGQ